MVEIKEFKREHLDGICEVEKICFEKPWSRRSFEEELENPLARYFVMTDGDKVTGYAGMWHIIDEGDITNIAVLPEYRNKGFGGTLLEKLISYGIENGLSFLTLEVRVSNTAAINLYRKNGFYEVGLRKKYYEGREDALLFRRDLI